MVAWLDVVLALSVVVACVVVVASARVVVAIAVVLAAIVVPVRTGHCTSAHDVLARKRSSQSCSAVMIHVALSRQQAPKGSQV